MDPTKKDEFIRNSTQQREEHYPQQFPTPDHNLRRLIEFQREKRAKATRHLKTFVTYGAYEDPV